MTDINSDTNPLFLGDEELRQGIELLFYAYRDFTAEPDAILSEYGFGRAHHRVIYFVGRNPGMTVSDLLDILKITKQSLSRVLGQLVREGFITQTTGTRDRRQRLLELAAAKRRLGTDLRRQRRVVEDRIEQPPFVEGGGRAAKRRVEILLEPQSMANPQIAAFLVGEMRRLDRPHERRVGPQAAAVGRRTLGGRDAGEHEDRGGGGREAMSAGTSRRFVEGHGGEG